MQRKAGATISSATKQKSKRQQTRSEGCCRVSTVSDFTVRAKVELILSSKYQNCRIWHQRCLVILASWGRGSVSTAWAITSGRWIFLYLTYIPVLIVLKRMKTPNLYMKCTKKIGDFSHQNHIQFIFFSGDSVEVGLYKSHRWPTLLLLLHVSSTPLTKILKLFLYSNLSIRYVTITAAAISCLAIAAHFLIGEVRTHISFELHSVYSKTLPLLQIANPIFSRRRGWERIALVWWLLQSSMCR